MVSDLLRDVGVISIFNAIADGAVSTDKETKYSLLQNMLQLYLRVRSFSTARDVTAKYRHENRKRKSKALRTELKNKQENKENVGK